MGIRLINLAENKKVFGSKKYDFGQNLILILVESNGQKTK